MLLHGRLLENTVCLAAANAKIINLTLLAIKKMEQRQKVYRNNMPSDQKFGGYFAFIFAACAAYAFYDGSYVWTTLWSTIAVLFLFLVLTAPRLLSPLNIFWYEIGVLLGKVVSPVILGAIFFVIITPVAMVTRLFGRDQLLMKKRKIDSYWIARDPVGPKPESFKNQF